MRKGSERRISKKSWPLGGEASLCVGIVAKYHKSDSIPDSDPRENQKYLDIAREGWRHFPEGYKLMQNHPECLDQTCIDGKWYMQDELQGAKSD